MDMPIEIFNNYHLEYYFENPNYFTKQTANLIKIVSLNNSDIDE